ncbi:MAG: AMP-binding protein [Pseudolabrys sp.]|nr:AMP-binding protein [Pseudolabrys sp.]
MINPFLGLTYAQALAALADRYGARDALVFRDRRYSFRDLKACADDASKRFAALGLMPGDKVSILMPNRPEFIWCWLGAAQMGLVVVMLNTRLRRDEIAYQLAQSDSNAVVIAGGKDGPDFLEGLSELAPALKSGAPGALASDVLPELKYVVCCEPAGDAYGGVTVWSEISVDDQPMPPMATDPDQPALIAYSSGTTALPKGAMITHCVWRKGWDIGTPIDLTENDCLYMAIPMFGSMATMNGTCPFWVRGAKVVLGEQFDAGHLLEAIERERVTSMHVLPPMIPQIVEHPNFKRRDRSSLRMGNVLSLDPDILAAVEDVIGFPGTITGYGMTETTTVVTRNRWDDARDVRHGTQGRPLPDIEVKLVDPKTLEPVPVGEPGEIWVRGYCVMLGYYKKLEETARAITPDGWLRTGDLCRQDQSGRIALIGRLGDAYKSRGFNVAPAEIEYVLQKHPAVETCAIVGVPDPRQGEIGIAFVVRKPGEQATENDVLAYLKPKIAGYKMPGHVYFIDVLPLTSGTGKVQKFKLREEALRRSVDAPQPAE